MKKLLKVPVFALLALLLTLASCGSSRTTTSRYPYPGSPYPYPDGRYPQGYPYPTPYPGERYPVYKTYPNYPPGQVKTVYRTKPVKVYAPGQRKKYDNDCRRDNKHNNSRKKSYSRF